MRDFKRESSLCEVTKLSQLGYIRYHDTYLVRADHTLPICPSECIPIQMRATVTGRDLCTETMAKIDNSVIQNAPHDEVISDWQQSGSIYISLPACIWPL